MDKSKTIKKTNYDWKKINKTKREEIQNSLKLLKKNLHNIDRKTIPTGIKTQIDTLNNYKNLNAELSSKVIQLMTDINELKSEKLKDINAFKSKAMSFGSQAQEEIKKFKSKFHTKNTKDLDEIKKYKSADILEVILDPINNIKLAIKIGKEQDSKELQNYLIGFEMLINQLESKLFDQGLTLIDPVVGDAFDPKIHTALSLISNAKQKNKIIEIKKCGYMLHDRVLIPATVIIGK